MAPQKTTREPRAATEMLLPWLAAGLIAVAACSNSITYSRIEAGVSDGGAGSGDARTPGTGGRGAGGRGGGAGQADAGSADSGSTDAGSRDAGRDVAIGSGGTIGAGGSGVGGMGVGGAGTGGRGTGGGPAVDNAQFNFEASAQGWGALGPFTGVARLTAQRFAGAASLGGTLTYTPAASGVLQELGIDPATGTGPAANALVTFHVFLPANASGIIAWIQPYIQDGSQAFIGAYTPAASLFFGGWNTIKVALPATAVVPIFKMAVQIFTSGTVAFTGNIYVDSISW